MVTTVRRGRQITHNPAGWFGSRSPLIDSLPASSRGAYGADIGLAADLDRYHGGMLAVFRLYPHGSRIPQPKASEW